MSFGDLLQESDPKKPWYFGSHQHYPKSRSNKLCSSASLHPSSLLALLQCSSSTSLPHKILKHHLCPRETPVLKLRTNSENLTLAPKGNANKSKPDRGYPTQGSGHLWAKKDGLPNTDSVMYQELMSFCYTTEKKPVRLDPKKPKGNKCHSNSHIAWNDLDTSNTGKAQGTERWSRRFTPQGHDPSRIDRTYRNHTHSIVFIWKKPLFPMFCPIQQEWDYSNWQQQSGQDCFPVSKDTYPVTAVL